MSRKSDWSAAAMLVHTKYGNHVFQCAECGKQMFLSAPTEHIIQSFTYKRGCAK